MEYLETCAVEVDTWLMINSLRQDISNSRDLKGLKTFVQIGKGMIICHTRWTEGCGLSESGNFIKVKVDKASDNLCVFTAQRKTPGTFLRGNVLFGTKVLHNSINKGNDKVFKTLF